MTPYLPSAGTGKCETWATLSLPFDMPYMGKGAADRMEMLLQPCAFLYDSMLMAM